MTAIKLRRPRSSSVQPHAARAKVRSTAPHGVIDAARDQLGGLWIRYGTERASTWFRLKDARTGRVFEQLDSIGVTIFRPSSKDAFFRQLEEKRAYRPIDVVLQPGWHGDTFVHPDHTVHGGAAPPIIGFESDRNFRCRGSIPEWKAEIGPIVAKQMIPMSVFAFALTGTLIRFSGNDMGNPILELVMKRESGKTSLLKAACALWGDDENSASLGLGIELSATINAIDDARDARSDGFLGLDETNHSRSGPQAEFLHNLVFSMESSASRRRLGEDARHTRLATLITTNSPIGVLLKPRNTGHDAAESRLVTIQADRMFNKPIIGAEGDERRAIETLSIICRRHAGCVAHEFTRRLTKLASATEGGIAGLISTRVRAAEDMLTRIARCSPRRLKTFALMVVAADLGRAFGIFDAAWKPRTCVTQLYRQTYGGTSKPNAASRVLNYLERHGVVTISKLNSPLERLGKSGYAFNEGQDLWICIGAEQFKHHFSDWRVVIADLNKVNALKTEGGKKPKSTIHAPRALSSSCRVFCFSKERLLTASTAKES